MSIDDSSFAPTPAPEPLRSVHTTSFPRLLDQLGVSVLVTTYQAGKLMMLREENGLLNTHFRDFNQPMGLALSGNRLAIGTATEILEYHNIPAADQRLAPPGTHDACFVPRSAHVTGNIQVHEMAWLDGDLVVVNTRFSCLCSLDRFYSFRPLWRPPFVTQLAPEDRCHLNGLGVAPGTSGGPPRLFVTALGQCDTQGGWRENKARGGLLMEASSSGTILARGLSMPHSPRWYDGQLWVLESGTGSIGTIDLNSGVYVPIAQMPGFTRGLDFCGPFAFIGLSQVRETAVFSGIPIAERALAERACGVWVVDIHTGETVAFVKFEDALQEIFAVQVLPGARYPELVHDDPAVINDFFVLPDESLVEAPVEYRCPGK